MICLRNEEGDSILARMALVEARAEIALELSIVARVAAIVCGGRAVGLEAFRGPCIEGLFSLLALATIYAKGNQAARRLNGLIFRDLEDIASPEARAMLEICEAMGLEGPE